MEEKSESYDEKPVYNSRLVNNYVEFLELHYPSLDIDSILEYAGMKRYQVQDPGHWFTQRHIDRLHEMMTLQTGNPTISREAGRFTASARSTGTIRKYALGFVSPHVAYRLVANIASHMTRGGSWTVRKLGPNRVEVTAVASPGIVEKPFQCENRLGMMEALGRIFTGKYSDVEHPSCMHRGDAACSYLISWKALPSFTWRIFGKYVALGGAVGAAVLFFLLPEHWAIFALIFALMTLSIPLYAESLEKKEMAKSLEMQGDAARERVEEINIRYSHSLLIQEIGQAASSMLDLDELMRAVSLAMKQHLGFDRGLLMLANKTKTRLIYKAGYGYSGEQEALMHEMEFSLENPDSKGLFAVTFRERRPFLLDNLLEERPDLSARSLRIAKEMGVQSLICVPIVYENEALGLLLVDNIRSRETSHPDRREPAPGCRLSDRCERDQRHVVQEAPGEREEVPRSGGKREQHHSPP